jgi:acetyltransferase-like isoleucine patch superfamily enzyme
VLPGVTIGKGTTWGANLWFQKLTGLLLLLGAPAIIKKYNFKNQKWEKI